MTLALIGFENIWMHGPYIPRWMAAPLLIMYIGTPVILGLFLHSYITCLRAQQKVIQSAAVVHPGVYGLWVWLQMIPGVHLFMTYIAVWKSSKAGRKKGLSPAILDANAKALGFLHCHLAVLVALFILLPLYYRGRFGGAVEHILITIPMILLLWSLILRKYRFRLNEIHQNIMKNLESGQHQPLWQENISPAGWWKKYRVLIRTIAFILATAAILRIGWRVNHIVEENDSPISREQFNLLVLLSGTGYIMALWSVAIFRQFKALKMIGAGLRTISPGYVWLQMIPGLNLIFSYMMARHISWSLKSWSNELDKKIGAQVDDLGMLLCHFPVVVTLGFILPRWAIHASVPLYIFAPLLIYWTLLVRQYLRALNDTLTSAATAPENSVKEVNT